MTPARIKALQWFFDQGETKNLAFNPIEGMPTWRMIGRMLDEGQVEAIIYYGRRKPAIHRLTDKGRRDLHEATR